jgi:tripartite-type tricarboxylate transporter receptor subunit TctC
LALVPNTPADTAPLKETFMLFKRRSLLAALAGLPAVSWSQGTKAIRLIVPYPPGGGTDILARQIAQGMAENLAQPVVVENRPGGNGQIAGDVVSKAEPDGTTLLVVENAFVLNPYLFKEYTVNPVRDFMAVSLMGTAPLVMVVNPSVPAANLREFVAYAKANPGKLSYGSAGNGNPTHICPELFKLATGTDILQVPYKGSGPAITDLMGGQVSMMFTGISAVKGFVEAGRLRAIGLTGKTRSQVLPQVPTLAEAGVPIPDLDQGTWWGVVGPAKLPKPIAARLAQSIHTAGQTAAIKSKLQSMSIEPLSNSPEEFASWISAASAKYGDLVKRARIGTS